MAPPRPQLQVPGTPARPGAARRSLLGRQLAAQPPCPRDPRQLSLPSGESEPGLPVCSPVPTTLGLTPLLACSLVPSALLPSQTSSLSSVHPSQALEPLPLFTYCLQLNCLLASCAQFIAVIFLLSFWSVFQSISPGSPGLLGDRWLNLWGWLDRQE